MIEVDLRQRFTIIHMNEMYMYLTNRNRCIIHTYNGKSVMKVYYTEKKKKRNNRPPRIFEFKGKTMIISGLLLYDSNLWDIRVYHAKNDFLSS